MLYLTQGTRLEMARIIHNVTEVAVTHGHFCIETLQKSLVETNFCVPEPVMLLRREQNLPPNRLTSLAGHLKRH